MLKKQKAILADEMGLGKTRQAILAAEGGVLVVCPASLKINWKREIELVHPHDQIEIISTTEEIQNWTATWFIINYDILEKKMDVIERLIDGKRIETLILDEAHYIKGKSIRAMSIIGGRIKRKSDGTIVKFDGIASKMKRVYCLTGTPLLNRPIELFNIVKAIDHPLGENRATFAKRYCNAGIRLIIRRYLPPLRIWDESGVSKENLPELAKYMSECMLRRKKNEVLDLPEKIISVMECEMTDEWKKNYDTAWDSYLEFLAANPIPEKNIDNIIMARQLVEIQKLKQVCSRAKISRIISDIENAIEQDEKVIVFSQYTATISEIAQRLKEKKIKCVTLTGSDDMNQRQKSVDEFQNNNEVKVFVANIKAGGVGLNLTAGSIVIFADMDWSPEIHRQAEDRAHRIGQAGTVNVYYYTCPGTIEDEIIDILNSKKSVADQILEGTAVDSESSQKLFLARIREKVINN